MKKRFISKNMIQKTLISIIIVLLLSFAVPVKSQAGIGGILLDPIFDLAGTLFDAVLGGLQMFLVDGEFKTSSDGGLLNPFLVEPDAFVANANGEYDEFQYNNGPGTTEEVISEDELEVGLLGGSSYYIPVTKYTPEKIFSGLIPALDINFINPTDWRNSSSGQHYSINTDGDYVPDDDGIMIEDPDNPGYYIRDPGYTNGTGTAMNERSVAIALHETIATWYVSLRNLSAVGLMLVLVYVGIRMVISSTASEKSKYKQMLMDWVVALCILFCLHYIMTFTTTIVNEISKAINGAVDGNTNNIAVTIEDSSGNAKYQFNTDLMGLIRLKMQSPTVWYKLLYLIFYMVMVIYTCLFTINYLKRVLMMAFLTLVAPLVALTYPIDKMRDGKAQAFDMWFKEYTFNALIQPFHLIIYTIFVGSAIDLSAKNPIFAMVALAFLIPAEKILRRFFGFDKATTNGALGALAGVAGGAAAFNMVSKALNHKGGGHANSGKGKNDIKQKSLPQGDKPKFGEAFSGSGETADNGGADNVEDTSNGQTTEPELTPEARQWEAYGNTGSFYGNEESSSGTSIPTSSASVGAGQTDGSQSGVHGRGARQWYDNDTRGLGQYALDVGKGAAGWVGRKISDGPLGELGRGFVGAASDWKQSIGDQLGEKKFFRKLGKGATTIRNFKPLANTAKGVANVAKKTTIAAARGTLRTAGRLAAAVPGAALGMAAGIASGDLGDFIKYTGAGAALSSAEIPSLAKSAGSFFSNAYKEGAHGSLEAQVAERQKQYVKDNEELYKQKYPDLSKKELKEKLQEGAYFDSIGIEGKDTLKAVELQKRLRDQIAETPGMSADDANQRAKLQAAVIMDTVKNYTEKDLRDEKKVQGLREDLSKKCEKQGLKGKEKKDTINMIVKEMKNVRGVDNDY